MEKSFVCEKVIFISESLLTDHENCKIVMSSSVFIEPRMAPFYILILIPVADTYQLYTDILTFMLDSCCRTVSLLRELMIIPQVSRLHEND